MLRPSVLFVVVLLLAAPGCGEEGPLPVYEGDPIRAVTLDARRPPDPGTLAALRDLGATHVAVVPFGWQEGPDVPAVAFDPDARWYSESDAGIRALAEEARALGLSLILKPHLWLHGDGEQERGAIGFESEAAWAAWEADYRTFLLHHARLAEAVGADVLCIGTELAGPARARPAFWRALADTVRTVYSGRLTYAANWWEEYEHIAFWDAVDFVGVQAYFPLSDADAPTREVLVDGWTRHVRAIEDVARRAGRPVLFTEVGYRSVPGAAAEPWRWPTREEAATALADDALQARLYEAFFEALWDRPWFAGAVVWKWYGTAPSGRHRVDFTPQGKPAEAVIRRWFRGDAPAAPSVP